MTEKERIESININGGWHLQNFKTENRTYPVCLAAVQNCGLALVFVPAQFRTEEIYTEACKNDGRVLDEIPVELRNRSLCEIAVQSAGQALQYVPVSFCDRDMCLKAAKSSSQAYSFIPIEMITPEFVAEAAKECGYDSISSLPKIFKNTAFYLELVKLDPEFIWCLPRKSLTVDVSKAVVKSMGFEATADAVKENPELLSRLHTSLYDHDTCLNFVNSDFFTNWQGETGNGFNTDTDWDKGRLYIHQKYDVTYSLPHMMKWPDVCIPLLKLDGYHLRFAKKGIITEDMCNVAVKSNSHALEAVPKKFKTKELCMLAFKESTHTIQYFPPEYVTEDLALEVVKKKGYDLEYLPVQARTKEVCMIAMSDHTYADIKEVPDSVIDKDICMAWLKVNRGYRSLDSIPDRLRDSDIYLAIARHDSSVLENAPVEYLNEKICLVAVKNSSAAAQFVPPELFTKEMAAIVVKDTDEYFQYIPAAALNEEICIKAIRYGKKYTGTVFNLIPDELKTQEMCNIAMDVSLLRSFDAVPEWYVTYEMLLRVAKVSPEILYHNFPEKFRTKEIIEKMISEVPRATSYLKKFMPV